MLNIAFIAAAKCLFYLQEPLERIRTSPVPLWRGLELLLEAGDQRAGPGRGERLAARLAPENGDQELKGWVENPKWQRTKKNSLNWALKIFAHKNLKS